MKIVYFFTRMASIFTCTITLLLCAHSCLAQATYVGRSAYIVNLVDSFGAIPNDGVDDTYALIKFSNFVLNRWRANGDSLGTGGSPNVNYSTHYIKLIVPAGTYNIAKQISIAPGTPLDSFYTWSTSSSVAVKKIPYSILFANAGNNSDGLYVTVVQNGCAMPNIFATRRYISLPNIDITQANGVTSNAVDGIHIVADGATFKYADSIRQGFVGPTGNAMLPDSTRCYSAYWSLYHSDYDAIRIYNCNNITVEGLEVDGNNVNALFMGPDPIDYFQGGATGIFLGASKNFTIKNCYLHHMSLDGLRIIDTFCESATKGEIRNVRCEYNFRQGLTWSEGDSVAIDSCSFSYTGRAVSNITGTEISSAPAAGVDIEYDGTCRMPGQLYVCKRGYFKHCKFAHNLSYSVENTYRYHTPFDSIVRSLDMNFDSCKFITNGGTTRALSVYGRKYSFTHCDIQGGIQNGYLGDSTDGGLSFDACKFTDHNDSGTVWRNTGQFFDCTGITYPKITNCNFHINGAYNKLGYLNWNSPKAAKHTVVWRNNRVVYDSCNANTTDYLNQLAISGVNSFSSNTGYTANSFRTIGFKYCNVLGDSSTSCTRDTLLFAGPILHALYYNTPDSFVLGTAAAGTGKVDYVLQDSAMHYQQSSDGILIIRPNARFIVAPSAGVYGLGKTHNLGAYIHSIGSYLTHEGAQFLSGGSGTARFYIPNGVNPQLERCNPYWITAAGYVFANNNKWINTYNSIQPCVQGNNQADFWSNANSKLPACNPVYNNINVQQFDICYKLLPATCNQYDSVQLDVHGASGSISIMADGTALPSAQYIGTHAAYITGMAAGVHTITVTDAAACSHQFTVNVSSLKAIPSMAIASVGHVSCNGQASGSCTTQVTTGAIAPYTFAWSNSATDSIVSNLSAGSYTCTATDANGCTASTTITITEPPALSFATPAITHVACNGESTGAVALSASGGSGMYTITPIQISNLAATTYTFTATDANGCTTTTAVTISQPTAISFAPTITHVSCNGASTGEVVLNASGGTGNINIPGQTTTLTAGTYSFTATDANGCTASTTITINEPPALSFAAPTITHVTCHGTSTGAVALSASGGTGTISITPAQTNLAAATYTFTATDANGCTATTTITITEPPALSFAAPTITHVACNGASTGAAALSASGGTGTITITPAQTNLAATTYTFTATDANGCTSTTAVTISQPTAISFAPTITHVSCNGASTGEVVLNASGGTGNINIPGQTTTLTAGTYNFTATDANNCTSTISISITQPSALQLTLNAYNESCGLAGSGRIEYVVDGGVTPYSLICSNSYSNAPAANTTYTIGPIAQGTYSTTLEDANGCIAESINTLYTPTTAMCACTNGELILETANTILLQNPSASAINTQFANGGTVSNKRFYIDGVLTIDQNITFDNCELYFTQLASVFNGSSHTITLNYSTLDAACDTWVGIIASGANAKVNGNNSTWRHANVGIDAKQNALVDLDQCTFEDGGTGIILEDATANPYPISIERCVFTTTPTVTPTTHMIGIHIEDIVHANIGDKLDASSGNSFTNLEIGVHIANKMPSCQVGIYNCTFDNIHDRGITGMWQHATKVNNCYTQKAGAAIWCKTKALWAGNTSVEVANTNAANANTAISNCDKGIVGLRSNATVRNVYIANTLMGVMLGASSGRDIDVQHCAVNNAFIGVQCSGNTSNLVIEDNTIDISTSGINTGLYSMIWPIGIDVKRFLNQTNDPAIIAGNTINLQGFSGVGINADNTNKMTNIELNTINLGYINSEDIVCLNASHLTGISARNVYGTQLQGNHINAPASMIGGTRTDISGILVDNSSQQQLHCNHSLNTPVSITVVSECLTPADKVKGNEANSAKFGWLFRHLGTEASFGDVGDANNDNNNLFVGTTFASKVFRFCELAQGYQIFTAPSNLVLTESNSEDINSGSSNTCVYDVGQLFSSASTYTCPSVYSITTSGGSGGETYFTLTEALAIATDIRQYAEFEDMAYWIDCRKLYYQLVADPVLRNSHTALLAFYNTMQSNVINEQRQADVALRNYISSFYANNEALLEQMRLAAENENDDIDNTEVQNNNDKQINAAYLTVSRLGLEGLSAAELGFVTALANNCPYIAGPAVYKAREINTLLQPGRIYDDLKECNTQGVFRLADTSSVASMSPYTQENEVLQSVSAKPVITASNATCNVYPNPSTGLFNYTISSSQDVASITIYNSIGAIVDAKVTKASNTEGAIDISDKAIGIYTYKIASKHGQVFTGKLILQ